MDILYYLFKKLLVLNYLLYIEKTTYLVMKKFDKIVIDKLILIICLVFQHKPCLQDPRVRGYPDDFQQLEKPVHYCRKCHFCLNHHNL